MESRETGQMNLFAGQEQRCRWREWMCGNGGGGGMNREIGTAVYTLPCVNETASGNLLCRAGSWAWRSVTTWKAGMEVGWGGVGRMSRWEGICAYIQLIRDVA